MNGRPLADDLPRMLDRPVRFANDANCLALSESTDGAAAGAGIVFAVIIGTGTGGGVTVHGRVLVGCNAIAGEWGHNPLPAPRESELRAGEYPACWEEGLPASIAARLNREALDILNSGEMKAALEQQGFVSDGGPPQAVVNQTRRDIAKWREVIAKTGIKAE